VFVQSGGSLTVSGTLTVTGNTATGGNAGPDGAAAGSGFGSAIFYQGSDGTVSTLTMGAGNQTISGAGPTTVIADYTGSGGTNPGGGTNTADQGGSLALSKSGGGTLTLSGANTYSGGTTVTAGTLIAGNNSALGSGTLAMAAGTTLSFATGADYTIANNLQVSGDSIFTPPSGQTDTISGVISDGTSAGSVSMQGAGTLVLDPTGGSNTYSGGTTIDSGTVDLMTAGAAGSGAITFPDPPVSSRTLEFAAANAPTNAIDNFGTGDVIQIDNFLETSAPTYSGGFLTLQGTDQNAPETVTLDVPGQALSDFQVNVGATDTVIDYVACYCRGTLIATERGEVPVETLAIGDRVTTRAGARPIKWIGRRSYGGRFVMGRKDILPVCIKAGALDDSVPQRDLWISPHHAMYFEDEARGGVLIEAKDLVNGVSIVQAEHVDKVEYFHIELDSHDMIVAEGAPSESFIDDDSRGMFHNAREYDALYPDVVTAPAHYCAPRRDEGYEVESARRRIALRAGLLRVADGPRIGKLNGYVDQVSKDCIAGWAQNADHPEAPICLDIYADGRLIGQTLANRYREDLQRAGLGSGRHSFAFRPPAEFDFAADAVEVRRSLDGAALQLSADRRLAVRPPKVASIQRSPNVTVHRRAASG